MKSLAGVWGQSPPSVLLLPQLFFHRCKDGLHSRIHRHVHRHARRLRMAAAAKCLGDIVDRVRLHCAQGQLHTLAIIAVISLVLILFFKPSKVKEADDKYRAAAGKPLDDALVGRK